MSNKSKNEIQMELNVTVEAGMKWRTNEGAHGDKHIQLRERFDRFLQWSGGALDDLEGLVKSRLSLFLSALWGRQLQIFYEKRVDARLGAFEAEGFLKLEGSNCLHFDLRAGFDGEPDRAEMRFVLSKLIAHAIFHLNDSSSFHETSAPPAADKPMTGMEKEALFASLAMLMPVDRLAGEIERIASLWRFDSKSLLLDGRRALWLWGNRVLWPLQEAMKVSFNLLIMRLNQTGFLHPELRPYLEDAEFDLPDLGFYSNWDPVSEIRRNERKALALKKRFGSFGSAAKIAGARSH